MKMIREDLISLIKSPFRMVEIGVDRGEFFSSYYSKDNMYHLVDTWEFAEDEYYSLKHHIESYDIIKNKIDGLKNVCIYKMPSNDAVRRFDDKFFDFVYIDANHDYKTVKNDIEKWLPKVAPGGIIAGHDYYPSPEYEKKYNFGVNKAVNELFDNFNLTNENYFKSWYVRV